MHCSRVWSKTAINLPATFYINEHKPMLFCPKCEESGIEILTTLDDPCIKCGTVSRNYKRKPTLFPYQQRVVQERDELNVKINALDKFINHTDAYHELGIAEQQRLISQLEVMHRYSSILTQRINAF